MSSTLGTQRSSRFFYPTRVCEWVSTHIWITGSWKGSGGGGAARPTISRSSNGRRTNCQACSCPFCSSYLVCRKLCAGSKSEKWVPIMVTAVPTVPRTYADSSMQVPKVRNESPSWSTWPFSKWSQQQRRHSHNTPRLTPAPPPGKTRNYKQLYSKYEGTCLSKQRYPAKNERADKF